MTQAETRTLSYAIAGSLAVHVLLAVIFALWIGLAVFHRMQFPPPAVEEEPEVTLVFPDPPPPPPVTPKDENPFIRTGQNTEAPQAPAKSDFISDRNTVASSKSAPSPNGDQPLPTMQGINLPTRDLTDQTFRDGETKNGAAAAMAPPAPPPAPQMKVPDSPPQPEIAKKEDTRAETMMKELDSALAKQAPPPEAPKLQEPREALPTMRTPEEMSTPRAIPVATPAVNKPKPEKDSFQAETHRGTVKGTINNPGAEDAVNAAITLKGRYLAQVDGVIRKKWHESIRDHHDAADPGKVGVHFYVNKQGKVEDLEFVFKEANPRMVDLTAQAIMSASIPPPPAELLSNLIRERMPVDCNFVILPPK